LKFIWVHHGNPLSENLWSGTPLNIVRTLGEQGCEVVVIDGYTFAWRVLIRLKIAFYRYVFKQYYLPSRDPKRMRVLAKETNRRLQEVGPADAVLCTFPPDAAFLKSQAPVIIIHDATWAQLLEYYPGYQHNARETKTGGLILDKLALERCDHAIYSSRWAVESAVRDCGARRDKLSFVSLGASLQNEPPSEALPGFLARRGQKRMKLFFLGVEWHRKGGDLAVEIAREIERRGVPVELHIVGVQPEGEMPAFVHAHGKLYKNVPGQAAQLFDHFESSDFMIMPTRADATPVVFCEAAAYGLPVITTLTGGVGDVVGPDWSLAMAPNTSLGQVADWAIQNFRDRERYLSLCQAARAAFEERLNWPAFCKELVRITKSLPPRESPCI
jgi:glycosyltransferase involved in cell wall biosynthesis